VLTLDSATEVLGGFRFGRRGSEYAYLPSADVLASIAAEGIGERSSAKEFPMSWAPPGWEMLFAVIPSQLPPHLERGGSRVVTPEFLIRDLLGFYGLRTDLLAEIEAKLK
jgi:hypothetical protein